MLSPVCVCVCVCVAKRASKQWLDFHLGWGPRDPNQHPRNCQRAGPVGVWCAQGRGGVGRRGWTSPGIPQSLPRRAREQGILRYQAAKQNKMQKETKQSKLPFELSPKLCDGTLFDWTARRSGARKPGEVGGSKGIYGEEAWEVGGSNAGRVNVEFPLGTQRLSTSSSPSKQCRLLVAHKTSSKPGIDRVVWFADNRLGPSLGQQGGSAGSTMSQANLPTPPSLCSAADTTCASR